MNFHKKLFWTDMLLLVVVLSLIFVQLGKLHDVLLGFGAALFVISISNHIRYYVTNKKFY
jgi:hypothetical protein